MQGTTIQNTEYVWCSHLISSLDNLMIAYIQGRNT